MKKDIKLKLMQAASCLLYLGVMWRYESGLGGTEFSGGWLTRPLLNLYDVGTLLFVLALLLAFFYRRTAAAVGLIAALLSFPLYLYFIAPGPVRHLFSGAYLAPLRANFVWNQWRVSAFCSWQLRYVSTFEV